MVCALVLVSHAGRARAESAPPRLQLAEPKLEDSFEDHLGFQHPFAATYERVFGNRRPPPAYARAVIEAVGILGIGIAWYWIAPTANSADWEFNSPLEKLNLRAVRFDNNKFTTNMALHPVSGSGYYGFARLNRLSIPLAGSFGVVYSTVWEYAFEWREKVSINDLIVTPFGGMALGECFYRLVEYVGSAPPGGSWARTAARFGLGWPRLMHEAMDGRFEDGFPPDELGMSSAYYHLFHLGYSIGDASNDRAESTFVHGPVLETEIVALPGYLRRGRYHLVFDQGNFTETRLRLGFASDGLEEIEAWFRSALFGYYAQDLSGHPLRGTAHSFALSVAYSHRQSWLLGAMDEYAFVHFPGVAWDEWLAAGQLLFHSRLEASFDFGAIKPAAFASWRGDNPDGTIKSVLSTYGYDFDWGVSGRLSLSLIYASFEAGLRFSYGRYRSIQGADRYEETITRGTVSNDELLAYRAWLGCEPLPWPLELRLALEARVHNGQLQGVDIGRSDRLASVELALVF